jgi:hypothetical protein
MKTLAFLALVSVACSSATAPPTSNLAGSYTLTSVNGTPLPALYTVPLGNLVVASSGRAIIAADFSFSLTVNTDAGAGIPTATLSVAGHMTPEGNYYHFAFDDARNGNGSFSGRSFSVLYPPNTLVFTKNETL